MRLLMGGIATCLFSLNLLAYQPANRTAPPATFLEHTIATELIGGYQVVASDINHDGKPDLIAVASGMKELIWFENPGWERHVLVANISRPINCAAWDIDGDAIPEIALAHEFANDPARSIGIVSLLKHKGDPLKPWEMTEIDRLSTSHRLRWVDIEGNGRKVLINAPLAGALVKPPDYKGAVPLVFYRPGSWKREIISEETRRCVARDLHHGLGQGSARRYPGGEFPGNRSIRLPKEHAMAPDQDCKWKPGCLASKRLERNCRRQVGERSVPVRYRTLARQPGRDLPSARTEVAAPGD
ncbi:MAG: VCBS repeat-containing protein [Acidobacteriota bacterium]